MKTQTARRWRTIAATLLAVVATFTIRAQGAPHDSADFPLGSLGGRAFQTPGSSLLKDTAITSGGPAASAGLQVGDSIHPVNGNALPIISVSIDDGWRGAVQRARLCPRARGSWQWSDVSRRPPSRHRRGDRRSGRWPTGRAR